MLRRFYRWLVHLHPPTFRKRFGEEMLSIFDESGSDGVQARLLADGVLSVLRQWIARPENWGERVSEPIQCSISGPVLFTLGNYKPRAGSVVSGGFVTLILFTAAWFVSEYTWTHPVFMPLMTVQVDTAYSGQSEPSAQSPLPLASIPSQLAPLARDSGMKPPVGPIASNRLAARRAIVVSAEKTPVRLTGRKAAAAAPILRPEAAGSGVATVPADRGLSPAAAPPVSPDVLQSYVGMYIAPNVRVAITDDDGNLTMEIPGEPKAALVPVSRTKFILARSHNDWVEFLTDETGAVRDLEVSQGGRRFRAQRSAKKTAKARQ